jgi:hypothetical protein
MIQNVMPTNEADTQYLLANEVPVPCQYCTDRSTESLTDAECDR